MLSNSLLNQIAGIGVQATISILSLAGTALVGVVVSYIGKKKDALITQLGVDKYNSNLTIAKAVYFQVEQLFKLIPGSGTLKATMFDKLLLAKIAGLTQDELDHFRESIVGEVNSQVTSKALLAPAFDVTKDKADVVNISPNIKADPSTDINQTAQNVAGAITSLTGSTITQ